MKQSKAHQLKMKRSIVNSRFLVTGWAILKYLPRLFTAPRIDGHDFYQPTAIEGFVNRVKNVRPDSRRRWGTMTPDQMLHHLNLAVGSGLGFYDLPDESYLLSRTLFRWILVDWFSEQPQGLRLPLNFVIPSDQHFDFDTEQAQLVQIIQSAGEAQTSDDWQPHPMFGRMFYLEWGKLVKMHIDYHLRQFGV